MLNHLGEVVTAALVLVTLFLFALYFSKKINLRLNLKDFFRNIFGENSFEADSDLDRRLIEIQRATRTTFPLFIPLHDRLRMKFRWYYFWHMNPWARRIHVTSLLVYMVAICAVSYGLLHVATPSMAQNSGIAPLATNLLGQLNEDGSPNYTLTAANNGSDAPNAFGFDDSEGISLDTIHHHLFVCDKNNNRVLVFDLDNNNRLVSRQASHVIGQANFSDNGYGSSADKLFIPVNALYDPDLDALFVADSYNSRVLVFDLSGGISDGMSAVKVLGQSNLDGADSFPAYAQNTVPRAFGLAYDSARHILFVSQYYRVSAFNLPASLTDMTDNENASYVLGQTDYNSSVVNSSQSGLFSSSYINYDQSHNYLFVANSGCRISVFDLTGNFEANSLGMNASWVLGQPNFNSFNGYVNQNGFTRVGGIYSDDHNRLFVSDADGYSSGRVLIFDLSLGIDNGMNANEVIGQASFTDHDATPTQQTLLATRGIAYDDDSGTLFVMDSGAHRIMEFTGLDPSPRYWVGDGSSSSWSDPANWSRSSGGAGGATSPGKLTPVVFDGANSKNGDVIQDADIDVASLDITSGYSGTFHASANSLTVEGSLTISGGTFDASSGNITANGDFSLDNASFVGSSGDFVVKDNFSLLDQGSFTAPSGMMIFDPSHDGDTFRASSGTFRPNGGTIKFLADNNFTLVTNGINLHNVIFDKESGGETDITYAASLAINGNLTIGNSSTEDANYTINSDDISYIGVEGNLDFPASEQSGQVVLGDKLNMIVGGDFTLDNANATMAANISLTGGSEDNVAIVGTTAQQVKKYDSSGNQLMSFGSSGN